MKPTARPTVYRGTRFRSRLEARWACFFDLAGWSWQYEPGDFEGWCPDFSLATKAQPVFVEVKPIDWPNDASAMNKLALDREDLEKVRRQTGHEILVLGTTPMPWATNLGTDGPVLGLLWNEEWSLGFDGPCTRFDQAILWEGIGTRLDFSASSNSYAYRIAREHDGDHHLKPVSRASIDEIWGEANRLTQWKGPRRCP